MLRLLAVASLVIATSTGTALAQPARQPDADGPLVMTTLGPGQVPPVDAVGNYVIGPEYQVAPAAKKRPGVPQGEVFRLTMESADSKIYPGIARRRGTFGTPDPENPARLIVTTSHEAPYTRQVEVYVPRQLNRDQPAPLIVGADGPDPLLFTTLDNVIAEGRVPAIVAVSIGNGGGDAQGSQRGLEYDTLSAHYAEFVETEVLPLVERECKVKITKDPNARATMGCSSGAACAFTMAWFRPDLYRRVLSYSGTYVNQQWPWNPDTPGGAWDYHERIIPESPQKPLRIWLQVSDRDLLNPNVMRDEMHDWVLANERMARVLAAKQYPYQFVFCRGARHCDRAAKQQTLPQALEWLWDGYSAEREQAGKWACGRMVGSSHYRIHPNKERTPSPVFVAEYHQLCQ